MELNTALKHVIDVTSLKLGLAQIAGGCLGPLLPRLNPGLEEWGGLGALAQQTFHRRKGRMGLRLCRCAEDQFGILA